MVRRLMQPDRDRAFGWRYAVAVRPWQRPRSYADGFWHGFGWGCAVCAAALMGLTWLLVYAKIVTLRV